MNDADLQQSCDHAQRALKLMTEHGLVPTPDNYALWFTYAGGAHPEIARAIEDCLSAGAITEDDCAKLHERFFSRSAAEKAMMELGHTVSAEIANVQNILESASRDTTSYGDALRGVSGQLTKTPDSALVKVVVDNLLVATRTMASRSQKLEERLQQSKDEVTRLQENVEMARAEARTDALTQLSNRKAFDEALARAIGGAGGGKDSLCLIIGDIDHFKTFNDSWGHQTGDQVLRLVAHCMRESVREGDVAARYGGEEFAVIMPAATLDAAQQIAERIRWSVESKRVMKRSTGEDLGTITLSLGVALFHPGEDGATFVKRADSCLYAAKRAGRNRVVGERQLNGTPLKDAAREEIIRPPKVASG